MPNTSEYKFTDKVKSYHQPGFYPSEKGGELLLVYEADKTFKGIQAFGPQGGVITENDLSPAVCEFLLNRKDPEGNLLYAHLLVKKQSADAKNESKNNK